MWAAVAGATLVGGLLGVLGTFLTWTPLGMPFSGQILQSVLMAPPVEEVMKLAAAALLVERMPYLVRSRSQLLLVGLGSGLGFAVIENILYLTVYINSPTLFLVLWRWIVCTALHVTCTYIAVCGLAKVWERTVREGRPPRMSLAGAALPLRSLLPMWRSRSASGRPSGMASAGWRLRAASPPHSCTVSGRARRRS